MKEQPYLKIGTTKYTVSRECHSAFTREQQRLQASMKEAQSKCANITNEIKDIKFEGETSNMRIKVAFDQKGAPIPSKLQRTLINKGLSVDQVLQEFMICLEMALQQRTSKIETLTKSYTNSLNNQAA